MGVEFEGRKQSGGKRTRRCALDVQTGRHCQTEGALTRWLSVLGSGNLAREGRTTWKVGTRPSSVMDRNSCVWEVERVLWSLEGGCDQSSTPVSHVRVASWVHPTPPPPVSLDSRYDFCFYFSNDHMQ